MPKHPRPSTQAPSTDRPETDPIPWDARDAAYRVLSAHAMSYPDLTPVEPDIEHLDPRDRALCHAIIRESVVRWITLRHLVVQLSGRAFESIEPRMQAVLIGASAQLLLLDRLPPHAVINESVEWAKRYIRPKAGGMTNAILRKIARARGEFLESWDNRNDAIPLSSGGALQLIDATLPDQPVSLRSNGYSLPKSTVKRWDALYPDRSHQLGLHTLMHPPTVFYCPDWSQIHETEDLEPHGSPDHRVYTGSRTHLSRLLDAYPELRVQDSASSSVVQSIPQGDYKVIVDYCAGQGTKTRQLVERFPDATIIAMEIDSARLDTLTDVFHDQSNVIVRHVERLNESTPNGIDLVLTDVPCSNSGVLARRMEARYRPMGSQVRRIAKIQQEILSLVVPRLNPGGTLVYSTCSIEPEENRHQRDWLIGHDTLGRDLSFIEDHQILPSGVPGDPPSMYTDGAYSCIFQRAE